MTDISFATRADLPAIFGMICALCAYHGDEAQVGLEHLEGIFFGSNPSGVALIAKQNGAPVGYAGLTSMLAFHERKARLDIHHLFVNESHRGQGIGAALIAAAKPYALETNAHRLTIGTAPSNHDAIAAYRAMSELEEIKNEGPRFKIDLGAT